jgi:hypothetical protein
VFNGKDIGKNGKNMENMIIEGEGRIFCDA